MIVVTGAGGFIGSHLVEGLVRRGERVLGLDLASMTPPNLAGVEFNFRYTKCDVKDRSKLADSLPSSATAVVHLAASVGVETYVKDPLGTIDNIVIGTRNLVELASIRKFRLVYLSTSEVYGKNPSVPWNEKSDRVLGAPSVDRWSYSTSKSLCEHMINAVVRKGDAAATIIRPFNVYGPRQRPAFVIPAAIQQVLNGKPPLIYDEGTQSRCFTYVSDLVEGIMRCIDADEAANETFNMGSEQETTIRELIRTILRLCDSDFEPETLSTGYNFGEGYEDIPRRIPDCSKALRLLGWKPNTELESGIRKTIEWAKRHPEWLRSQTKP